MNKLWIIIIAFIPLFSVGQFTDDFSDGNFTGNPIWLGNTAQFEVNTSFQLHLISTVADTSYLSTQSTALNNTEWQFWVRLSFQTSGNNNARVYLASDQQDITGSLNGYFVQIGETNDSIALCRQDGNSVTKIIPGTIAYTNNSTNTLRIKVIRDASGNWELFSDPIGGTNFQTEGTCNDNTYQSSAWFGVFCKYTISNASKFYFDDFYAGNIIVDTIPPALITLNVVSPTEIDLKFSEGLDKTIAENTINYPVNKGIGDPLLATVDQSDNSLVHLTFLQSFTTGEVYTMTITGIKDLSGNIATPIVKSFSWYSAQNFDIVINEIMADPDPVVGVPNYEYIELYNRTALPVNIGGFILKIGSSEKPVPAYIMQPDEYLILTSTSGVQAFSGFGNVLGFSSFSITNSGTSITLYNALHQVLHSVTFTDAWYRDNIKINGGWSLEMIDPMNPCGEMENWKVASNLVGGTPGAVNSVKALNPDQVSPKILRVAILDNYHLKVLFNEKTDSSSFSGTSAYSIDHSMGQPVNIQLVSPDYKEIILTLPDSLKHGIIYTLTVLDTLKDCAGNIVPVGSSVKFAIPYSIQPLDIVINEVLFDPREKGVDYVEIYNRSSKVLDLKDLYLASFDPATQLPDEIKQVSLESFQIFPGEYYVLTTNPAMVMQQYICRNPDNFVLMSSLPTFSNESGNVVLADFQQIIVDKLNYTDAMQFPLLSTVDGVALERVSYERPTQELTNWHSAAESVGYGTPTYQNSQLNIGETTSGEITIDPEIFSPDNDGFRDILNINYAFDQPGYVANILIYDSRGRQVKSLVNNELLGTSGTFSWDGIDDNLEKASIGIYIIYAEIFDLSRNVKHFKKTTVLGGKL